MIGDFILWIQVFCKRLVCIHDYTNHYNVTLGFGYKECKKCGRTRYYS